MENHDWLDKYIEEQRGNREIMKKICKPYTPAELCELITEQDEMEMRRTK